MAKINKYEKFAAIMSVLEEYPEEMVNEDISVKCLMDMVDNEMASLLHKKEAAAAKAAEREPVVDELVDVVAAAVGTDWMTKEEIAAKITGDDVTVGKVANRIAKLVREGVVEKEKLVTVENNKAKETTRYRKAH